MIQLHPIPEAHHICPHCNIALDILGWYIPGMRTLASLACSRCERQFYGDLPSGHGLYYPMLLEKETGFVHNNFEVAHWFATWLEKSYTNRANNPLSLTVEEFNPLGENVVLLNCLDVLYGHCLLKLLNAQYYLDHHPKFDVVVLIPEFLRWMVPAGVAAIWTVSLPLRRGSEWNDWLAAELAHRIAPLEKCWLSVALSHPASTDFDIKRFTQIEPFPLDEWTTRLSQPTVTFIWRADRRWANYETYTHWSNLLRRLKRRLSGQSMKQVFLNEQQQRIITLAQSLQQTFSNLNFAVVGLGPSGGLPSWIIDYRTTEISDTIEHKWCQRYAQSHVVVGVHGSNMLLPSAHAGAVVELVADNWANLLQDMLLRPTEARDFIYRYRFLPTETSADTVAKVVMQLLYFLPFARFTFMPPWVDHQTVQRHPHRITNELCQITQQLPAITQGLSKR